MFVHEIDELATLQNFHRVCSPSARLVVSFRNELFSLFTLNEHTLDFYTSLLDDVGHSPDDKQRIREYFEPSCRNKFAATRPGGDVFKRVFHKFHNPLTVHALFEQGGFRVEEIFYLNMHPAPPLVLPQIDQVEVKAAELEQQWCRSWQGMFVASSFLVRAARV